MRELPISVILELDDHYCPHLDRRVIHSPHPTIAVWVVRDGGNFLNPNKLAGGIRYTAQELS